MKSFLKKFSPLLLLLAAVIWGFAFSAQKEAAVLPPFTVGAARNLIGVVFLIPLILGADALSKNGRKLFSKKGLDITKNEWIGGLVCGVALYLASGVQQIGIGETDAGKSAFITALYVVIVPVYSLFFGKRSPANVWCGAAIAVAGFWLLCIKSGFTVAKGDLITLLCAFLFGFQILAVGHFAPKCDGFRLSALQFFVDFVLSSITLLLFERPIDFSLILHTALPLLYLGICSSGIAYTAQVVGQANTPAPVASILMSLESVFGVLGGAAVLGEVLTPREYLGCAVVFLGVITAQIDPVSLYRERKAKKSAKTGQAEEPQKSPLSE